MQVATSVQAKVSRVKPREERKKKSLMSGFSSSLGALTRRMGQMDEEKKKKREMNREKERDLFIVRDALHHLAHLQGPCGQKLHSLYSASALVFPISSAQAHRRAGRKKEKQRETEREREREREEKVRSNKQCLARAHLARWRRAELYTPVLRGFVPSLSPRKQLALQTHNFLLPLVRVSPLFLLFHSVTLFLSLASVSHFMWNN